MVYLISVSTVNRLLTVLCVLTCLLSTVKHQLGNWYAEVTPMYSKLIRATIIIATFYHVDVL